MLFYFIGFDATKMDLALHNEIGNDPLQFDKHIYLAQFKIYHVENPGEQKKTRFFRGTLIGITGYLPYETVRFFIFPSETVGRNLNRYSFLKHVINPTNLYY